MRFSIIMPVYNAGKYLLPAIDSVLSQSFRDFELILIDDGSIDGSGEVCDEYCSLDNRVSVVHQENKGICAARNVGIELAKGEYIGFCDHDDEYMPGYLKTAESEILKRTETNIDIIKFNRVNYDRYCDGKTILSLEATPYNTQEWNCNSDYGLFTAINSVIWNGFYNKDFLLKNKLHFDTSFKYGGEDIDFMEHALACATNVLWNKSVFYVHYNNKNLSVSSKSHSELFYDYLRTIGYELVKFNRDDCDWVAKRLHRWVGTLNAFVIQADGCDVGLLKKQRCLPFLLMFYCQNATQRNLLSRLKAIGCWGFLLFAQGLICIFLLD